MDYQAPHEVRDTAHLARMIESLRNGKSLPPILVCGGTAFSGSHRLEAWRSEGVAGAVVEITDEEYCDAMRAIGLDPVYDHLTEYDDFWDALRANGVDLGAAE